MFLYRQYSVFWAPLNSALVHEQIITVISLDGSGREDVGSNEVVVFVGELFSPTDVSFRDRVIFPEPSKRYLSITLVTKVFSLFYHLGGRGELCHLRVSVGTNLCVQWKAASSSELFTTLATVVRQHWRLPTAVWVSGIFCGGKIRIAERREVLVGPRDVVREIDADESSTSGAPRPIILSISLC